MVDRGTTFFDNLMRLYNFMFPGMGMGGGDSLGKLMSDSRDIGEDIGKFLVKWAGGKDLK